MLFLKYTASTWLIRMLTVLKHQCYSYFSIWCYKFHLFFQVADCSKREFTDQKRREMTVAEFISYWLKLSSRKDSSVLRCNDDDESLLYLKDWHFFKVRLEIGYLLDICALC